MTSPVAKGPSPLTALGTVMLLLATGLLLGWCALRAHWAGQERWDTILRWDAQDAVAWKNWADRQTEIGPILQGYDRASSLAPEDPYYREALAQALEAAHRPEAYPRAVQEYQAALAYAPARPQNALAIGRILFLFKQPDQALHWFQKALRIEPNYWECDLWEARCLARLNKRRQAAKILMELKERRGIYLNWRDRVERDLPSRNDPSAYERSILAYDERVVDQELQALKRYNSELP